MCQETREEGKRGGRKGEEMMRGDKRGGVEEERARERLI